MKIGDLVVTHDLKCPEGMEIYYTAVTLVGGEYKPVAWAARFKPDSRVVDSQFHAKGRLIEDLIPHIPPCH